MSIVALWATCFKLSAKKKTHANPTIINEKIKEIHILTVGGVPGISNFKSRASPPCAYLKRMFRKIHMQCFILIAINATEKHTLSFRFDVKNTKSMELEM